LSATPEGGVVGDVYMVGRLVGVNAAPCHLSDDLAGNKELVFRARSGRFLGAVVTDNATWVGLPGRGTTAPTAGRCRQTASFAARLPLAPEYRVQYMGGVPVWRLGLDALRANDYQAVVRFGSGDSLARNKP
jgi:hypothetical protein